ncbi:hypothetical protein JW964_13300 [candidate division KSB1 bacterium]|nr:hypothetical protein [candidate division KSB1 bacterium]
MKYIIKSGWLIMMLLLIIFTLNAQEQRRKPPKDGKLNLNPPEQTIEDLMQELGSDWENRILENIKTEYPDELDNLLNLKNKNPKKYERRLIKFWQEIRHELRLKKEDQQRYKQIRYQHELDHRCENLAEEYRKTRDKSRQTEIRNELKSKLAELFVLREAEKEAKIAELEREIKQLKEMAALRRQKQDEIIQKRLDEMLNERFDLEW